MDKSKIEEIATTIFESGYSFCNSLNMTFRDEIVNNDLLNYLFIDCVYENSYEYEEDTISCSFRLCAECINGEELVEEGSCLCMEYTEEVAEKLSALVDNIYKKARNSLEEVASD